MTGSLFSDTAFDGQRREIAPGAVHIPHWLSLDQQREFVKRFEEWTAGPVPLRAPKVRGNQMSVKMVCLGWHWQPYKYTRDATDVNGQRVLDMPAWLIELGKRAVLTAYQDPPLADAYAPDTALLNYYDDTAKMGMHQDKDEKSLAPVVSLSIGNSCQFRFGNSESRKRPYVDITLESGDLFVFGGLSRLAYHGVTKIYPHTAPQGCGLESGRINITMRVTGLT